MHNRLIMYPHENSLFPRSGSCGTELVSIFEWVIFISSVAIQSGFSKHSVCRFTAVPWITSLYLNFHDFWNFFFASCVYQNPHWLESVIAPHAEPYESWCHIQNTHPWFHQISNSEYFCFSWQWHMIMIIISRIDSRPSSLRASLIVIGSWHWDKFIESFSPNTSFSWSREKLQ